MKRLKLYFLAGCIVLTSCKKTELAQINPNQPTPAALTSEEGITAYGLGIFEKWLANVPGAGGTNIMNIAMMNHSMLGDEIIASPGNFGWRYVNQVYSITLPSGTTIVTPIGVEQKTTLQSLNSRTAGNLNAFMYEFAVSYQMIIHANNLLKALANPTLKFSGDAATKKNTLTAWAYWWKGYSYSRVGSMYLSGVINNAADGTTNGIFVDHNAIIAEANRNLDSTAILLSTLDDNDDYEALMQAIIPTFFTGAQGELDIQPGILTPAMWLGQVYTMEARNLLVNKKTKDMTAADWASITDLTAKGVKVDDKVFVYASDPNLTNDLSFGVVSPFQMIGYQQFSHISERLIQDFKTGDNRLTKGFNLLDPGDYFFEARPRGLQFGSRYEAVAVGSGGYYSSDNNNLGSMSIACTWSENTLMKAEALLHTGDIEGGLKLIDAVRTQQGAGLNAVAGTGLTLVQALEELRRERRIGLLERGLAFYDARRWGVTEPLSAGGGRTNAMVLVPGSVLGLPAGSPFSLLPCTLDYRYMDYWDIPQNELDFNTPASGSAPVKNN